MDRAEDGGSGSPRPGPHFLPLTPGHDLLSLLLQSSRPMASKGAPLLPLDHACSGCWRHCWQSPGAPAPVTPGLERARWSGSPPSWATLVWRPLQGGLRPQRPPQAHALVQLLLGGPRSGPRKALCPLCPKRHLQKTSQRLSGLFGENQLWGTSWRHPEIKPVASVPKWGGHLLSRAAGPSNPWPL